jgi:hypothetical protein
LAGLSDVFVLLREHIPTLWRRGKTPIWAQFCLHFSAAHGCFLNVCRVERELPVAVAKFFVFATQMDLFFSEVRYALFWGSLSCSVPEWERPKRRVLLTSEAEWQGTPYCRIAICNDAVLVISPSEFDKKVFSKLPSSVKHTDQVFEMLPLSSLTASIDGKTGIHIVLEMGASKYRFVPHAPVSAELWLSQFELSAVDWSVSRLGLSLKQCLFQEDTNIPIAAASICETLRQRGESFSNMWLVAAPPLSAAAVLKGKKPKKKRKMSSFVLSNCVCRAECDFECNLEAEQELH